MCLILWLTATHSRRVSLTGREAWKLLTRQRASWKLTSWSLVSSLTHTLIFHSRVSLAYGSTCSLLVLSYYKCLLRLNSDIAKAVCQCSNSPSSSLARPWAWNSVRTLSIQWHSELPLIKAKSLPYTEIYHHLGRRKFQTKGETRIDT